jgi:hypothetical protein
MSVPHWARLPRKKGKIKNTQFYHGNIAQHKLMWPLWRGHYICNHYILLITFTIRNSDAGPANWDKNTLLDGSNVRLNWNIESDLNVYWIKFKNFLSLY